MFFPVGKFESKTEMEDLIGDDWNWKAKRKHRPLFIKLTVIYIL